jgi:mannose/fructose/N-acetylgalactosamine-specific phosphotransferase system component IID
LPNGSPVVINTDGTVSVITASDQELSSGVVFESAGTVKISTTFDSNLNKVVIAYRDAGNSNFGTATVGTVSGTSISFGTPVVFESATTSDISTTFDSNLNKVVIAYRDDGNSGFGTAIVGTVSGTSISFGTPVVFESASTFETSTTFDSNLNKVVIAYRDAGNSNFGTAIVGTVSGTSISFGTARVFESAYTSEISTTFDSNLNKVVIAYMDQGNSNFGTAIVGTVSGTSISFGTPVVFESANTFETSTTFDSNLNKVVIAYFDGGNSYFGTAIVGTVSGTSISFGTPVVFESAYTPAISTTFDSNLNKVVIAYRDLGNSSFGTAIVGTVSGTSISFGTPVVFESALTSETSTTFDSNLNKVVIAYTDGGNSSFGTAVVFKPEENPTNLGVFNFIGFSSGSYADTQTATVQLISAVNEAQSGLTTAARYFVQTDGTLSTTAGSPEVYAGLAVSPTKIIVKG